MERTWARHPGVVQLICFCCSRRIEVFRAMPTLPCWLQKGANIPLLFAPPFIQAIQPQSGARRCGSLQWHQIKILTENMNRNYLWHELRGTLGRTHLSP